MNDTDPADSPMYDVAPPVDLAAITAMGLGAFALPQVMTWLVTGAWPYWLAH